MFASKPPCHPGSFRPARVIKNRPPLPQINGSRSTLGASSRAVDELKKVGAITIDTSTKRARHKNSWGQFPNRSLRICEGWCVN